MKIKVILASSSKDLVESQLENRKQCLLPDTEIRIIAPSGCPPSTETYADEIKAAPHILTEAINAESEGYHAVTVDCTLEPGLIAAKKKCNIPVVGAGEAALSLAMIFGELFSIIVPTPTSVNPMRAKIRKLGYSERLASVRSIDLHVLELENYDRTLEQLEIQSQEAINKEGAEVIILGCTVMGPIASKLADRIKVPVIEPGTAALKVAESLCDKNWKRSLFPGK